MAPVELTGDTFESALEEASGVWFVNWFSAGCDACDKVLQAWQVMAKRFEHEPLAHVATVNCSAPACVELCQDYDVFEHPTLMLYVVGGPRQRRLPFGLSLCLSPLLSH